MTQPKHTKTCERCGVEFVTKWPNNPNRFCSHACRLTTLHDDNRVEIKARIEKACEFCGTAYLAEPWNANKRRWCGRACTDAAHKVIRGVDHPLYKPKVMMACEVCGAVKAVKPSLVSRFRSCSNRCNAALAQMTYPRTSSLERAVMDELTRLHIPFQAQAKLRWYIVDFYLPQLALVIECDGAYWHAKPNQIRIDKAKDTYLRNRGITVARITEAAIKAGVVGAVDQALHRSVLHRVDD